MPVFDLSACCQQERIFGIRRFSRAFIWPEPDSGLVAVSLGAVKRDIRGLGIELFDLRVAVFCSIASRCSRMVLCRTWPQYAMGLFHPCSCHAHEIIGSPFGTKPYLIPYVFRVFEIKKLLCLSLPSKLCKKLPAKLHHHHKIRSCLCNRLDRFFNKLVSPFRLAVSAFLF